MIYKIKNNFRLCVCDENQEKQIDIMRNVQIAIGTPKALFELRDIFDISTVTYVVLDQIDRMLDMEMDTYIRNTMNAMRPDRQTVMTRYLTNLFCIFYLLIIEEHTYIKIFKISA